MTTRGKVLYVPAAALAAVLALAACSGGSSGTAETAATSPAPSPTFTALSLVDACKALRADILANGGTPDRATLQRIIGHSTDGNLVTDAQQTLREVGNGPGLVLQYYVSAMGRDCRRTGVQIPYEAAG